MDEKKNNLTNSVHENSILRLFMHIVKTVVHSCTKVDNILSFILCT